MKVSILIPCYNAAQWITQSIQSALDQTYPDREVVVVDDGSTDNSLCMIKSFGSAIRWETGPNQGGNVARNRLMELSTGEWLQYLDADDYLLPEKISNQIECLERFPKADVICSPVDDELWDATQPPKRERRISQSDSTDPWVRIALWSMPQTGGSLFRRTAVERAGRWTPEQPCCQDEDLYFKLMKSGARFEFCDKGGAVYRHWTTDTVSKRNPMRTMRVRLGIVRRIEDLLAERNEMTPARRTALIHAQMQVARTMYVMDRAEAATVVEEMRRRYPGFRLPPAIPFPPAYRMAYRFFGFRGAESMAALGRPLRQGLSRLCGTSI